ncbi:hypothetical protein GQX74_008784 [Glossina fuscipes]|nr:hypothetical protein GQX74_008784 [Glossina fuscipes]
MVISNYNNSKFLLAFHTLCQTTSFCWSDDFCGLISVWLNGWVSGGFIRKQHHNGVICLFTICMHMRACTHKLNNAMVGYFPQRSLPLPELERRRVEETKRLSYPLKANFCMNRGHVNEQMNIICQDISKSLFIGFCVSLAKLIKARATAKASAVALAPAVAVVVVVVVVVVVCLKRGSSDLSSVTATAAATACL